MRWLLLLLLALPLVAATHIPEGTWSSQDALSQELAAGGQATVVEYEQDIHTSNVVGSFSLRMFSGRFDTRPEAYPSRWIIEVGTTKTIQQNSNGVWNYSISVDSVPVPNCFFTVQTFSAGGFLTNMITYPNYPLTCVIAAPSFGHHWVNVTRTVASGTPATVSASMTSIVITRVDYVVLDMPTGFEELTGLTALEFLIFPTLALIGYVLWGRSNDVAVRGFGGALTMLSGALLLGFALAAGIGSIWGGTVAFSIVLMVLGGYLIVRMTLDYFTEEAL